MALLDILYRIDIALNGMYCLHSRYTYRTARVARDVLSEHYILLMEQHKHAISNIKPAP